MLYDEPTTGLDPIMSDVINELILQTRRQHPVTSIVVTHDMKTARKVADRIVMLCPLPALGPGEGQVLLTAPPRNWRSPRPPCSPIRRGRRRRTAERTAASSASEKTSEVSKTSEL